MPASETKTSRRVLDLLRFAVPWDAAVAVIGSEVEGIGRRLVMPLLPDSQTAAEYSDSDAIARLEGLRAQGYEFLVVGPSAYGWLDARPGFRHHLESRYRLVDRATEAGVVYALHGAPGRTGTDGLPLPPADMIRMTSGLYRRASDPEVLYERFETGGAKSAAWIRDLLARNGVDLNQVDALLDFGCGCGRVVRHWSELPGRVHGSDYNPILVRWCADNLPFAKFVANAAEPPLPYPDGSFDFLYSISIFTHLDEPLQMPWIRELARVMRPGGLIMITVAGEDYAHGLPAWEQLREAFEAGRLVVRKPERTGSNACAVLHPPEYVRDTLTAGLEIVDHEPGVPHAGRQDALLLRTPVS
jgi:SAM-dependent methyltransferase